MRVIRTPIKPQGRYGPIKEKEILFAFSNIVLE